jgi:hypothetical protein
MSKTHNELDIASSVRTTSDTPVEGSERQAPLDSIEPQRSPAARRLLASSLAALALAACSPGEGTGAQAPPPIEAPASEASGVDLDTTPSRRDADQSSTTTSTSTPVANEATTTVKSSEKIVLSEAQPLADADKQAIVQASKFEGLSSYELRELDRFRTESGLMVVLVGVERATLGISREIIQNKFKIAEQVAALREPVAIPDIWLGPGVQLPVEIIPRPADLTPKSPDTSYIIVSDIELALLAAPIDVSRTAGTTKDSKQSVASAGFTHREAYVEGLDGGVTVSLLRKLPQEATIDHQDARLAVLTTEIIHAATEYDRGPDFEYALDKARPDMSYIPGKTYLEKKDVLAQMMGDINANSMRLMIEEISAGRRYDPVIARSIPMKADGFDNLGAMYIGFDSDSKQYRLVRQLAA